MSKKANKVQMRKLQTRAAIEKKRNKKHWSGEYPTLTLENDYYNTVDHYTYDDLQDLLDLPRAYVR